MGEDVAEAGTTFKVLTGLVDEFGKDRIIDTPISEAGFSGIGVGAAMAGMRPIIDIMFGDFLTIIMDQMVNQAAKIHYMSGGKWKVPMVFRLTMGATRRSAASAWPTMGPGPGRTETHPSGTPASSSRCPSRSALSGVSSAGFKTTGLPAASAGATLIEAQKSG